jgi:outer membrane protein OmpA-like peptidoglycan-associated protein
MKRTRIFRIFGIAVILSLLVLAVPALPAMAATIELDPSSGEIGDSIHVTSDDFTAYVPTSTLDSYAEIYFAKDSASISSGQIDDEVDTYAWVAESDDMIDEDGYFEADFEVPDELNEGDDDEDVDTGTYYVYVTITRYDVDTGDESSVSLTIRAKATFTVTGGEEGTLNTLSPASGLAGTTVTVSGSNFAASSTITFKFDSTTLTPKSGSTKTSSSGSFTSTLTIPSTATAGSHIIYVTVSGTTDSATFTITANAALDPLSPATGKAGTDVTIMGSNFPASTALVFKFGTTTVTPKSGNTATGSGGQFLSVITVPAAATAGAHTITVTAGSGTATATFTVTASAALDPLSPATGKAGTDVTVSGVNFLVSYPIIFKFDSATLSPKSGDVNTGTSGSFTSIITIPQDATADAHTISVTVGTATVTAPFTVTGAPPPPTPTPTPSKAILSINQSGNTIGSLIGIGGAGFTPGANVTFKYDSTLVATVKADASGLVMATFKAPPSKGGPHYIIVSDGANTANTTYTVETKAPPVPPPLLPEMGAKVKSPITFDWTDVTDDSLPVTYELQIATDKTFTTSSIVLDKKALDKSEYIFTETDELDLAGQADPYFWRVKSIDAALNESGWTGTGEFYVGAPSSFPKWALYTIIAVAALLIFFIGFWIGRRTAFYY